MLHVMPVSAALNLIGLVAEPGVLHYMKLFLNFSMVAVVGIFLRVRTRVTLGGSMELTLFFAGFEFQHNFRRTSPGGFWWPGQAPGGLQSEPSSSTIPSRCR